MSIAPKELLYRITFRVGRDAGDMSVVANAWHHRTDAFTSMAAAAGLAGVTFGGPDLQTAYIGSLKGTRIPYFRAPVPGLPMVHWNE